MQENYEITIIGRQTIEQETGEIQVDTLGDYSERNGIKYISYMEYDSDAPTRAIRKSSKIEPAGTVTMLTPGSPTRLVLEKGRRHKCMYDTGAGLLSLGVFTHTLKHDLYPRGRRAAHPLYAGSRRASLLRQRNPCPPEKVRQRAGRRAVELNRAASEYEIQPERKIPMSKAVSIAREQVSAAVRSALEKAMDAGTLAKAEIPAFTVERPADRTHGDFATNAAMVSARAFRTAPQKIAAAVLENLDLAGTYFTKAETAGPGFMNFFLSPAFYADVLQDVLASGENYGRSDYGKKRRVMVEFVSANPTGPMHMGNARGGALGDCLAAVLDAAGYDVWREFYVNDAGNQLDKFGLSLSIRYQQLFAENPPELPEDSYHGEDILDLAKEYAAEHGDALMRVSEEERRAALVGFGLPRNIAKMQADMEKYRVHYDRWFLESDLHKDGEVMAVVDYLRDRGLTYEKDGAVWYKATEFGGEKDEVLVRANGNPTYFTADIAYHKNKFDRGFDLLIDIWGSDHHGPRRPHEGRDGRRRRGFGQAPDHPDAVRPPDARRRDRAHEQAHRQGDPARRPARRGAGRFRPLPLQHARGQLPARLRPRPRGQAGRAEPGFTTSSTRTRASAASCAPSRPTASRRATARPRSSRSSPRPRRST